MRPHNFRMLTGGPTVLLKSSQAQQKYEKRKIHSLEQPTDMAASATDMTYMMNGPMMRYGFRFFGPSSLK